MVNTRIRIKAFNVRFIFATIAVLTSELTIPQVAISANSRPALANPISKSWAVRSGNITLMTFSLISRNGRLIGIWRQPSSYNLTGEHIAGVKGPPISRAARSVSSIGHKVSMVFTSPFAHGKDDEFVIVDVGHGGATLRWNAYSDVTFNMSVISPRALWHEWEPSKNYKLGVIRPVNSELAMMFEDDQTARRAPDKIDWNTLRLADSRRRSRTQELLDQKQLSSGTDYYHAAYIFQHGYTPNDYLKAHVLALVAVSRGYDASWIAAATLDRYLQSIDRPQILGTQYRQQGKLYTQEPFDRSLLSDVERQALHVPNLESQENQKQILNQPLIKK